MTNYIHGATDEREVLRLEKQARLVATFSLTDFDATTTDAISGSNIGKAIGIRISTQSIPSALPVQTSFDFDNVRVYAPEPASISILGGVAIFFFGPRRRGR